MNFKAWLLTTRTPFLPLSVTLVSVGTAAAYYDGFFNFTYFLLALLGLILTHLSVNTLNEYFDYKTGIDFYTVKTPFSGGSGILPAGLVKPHSVYRFGIGCLTVASAIGLYFLLVKGLMLLPVILLGALFTVLYSTFFARILLGEFSAGMGLGTLPVLGSYFVQAGFYGLNAFLASIPCGILTFNLLLLNEFPDVEADAKGGRRNLVIFFGSRGGAFIYSALTITLYVFILAAVSLGFLPPHLLLSLLTIPFAYKAIRGSFKFKSLEELIPALKMNVIVVLATQGLMALGYVAATLL